MGIREEMLVAAVGFLPFSFKSVLSIRSNPSHASLSLSLSLFLGLMLCFTIGTLFALS